MKKKTLSVVALAISLSAMAQKPKTVLPYCKVQEPIEWYQEQEKAWAKYTAAHPKDANAWYNRYYALRLKIFQNQDDHRSADEKQKEFEKLYAEIEKNIPNTYESNLIKWKIGGMDMTQLPYLLQANELGEGRTEHLDDMVNIMEITGKSQERMRYSKIQYDAGMLSAGMMNYNYNVLKGLESNAILLTAGDNDTYPAWALQALGIRKDVTIINVFLLLGDDYRKRIFAELGIKNIAVDWTRGNTENNFQKKVLTLIANNSKGYPFYIALTAAHLVEKAEPPIEDNLYLTGMAYLYSKESIDNTAALQRNFEQNYALDYLKNQWAPDLSQELVNRINSNYLVPMLKLYEHYKNAGEQQKQDKLKALILGLKLSDKDLTFVKKHLS